jgi:hypothetical protein
MAKRKRKKNVSAEDRTTYRRQASVEAAVARAKLARAEAALTSNDLFTASNLATEAAFDAGLSNGFALLSGDAAEQQHAKAILSEAKTMQAGILNIPIEDATRVANPIDGESALEMAKTAAEQAKSADYRSRQVVDALAAAFYAGTAYGYGQATGDETLSNNGMRIYQAMVDEIPWAPQQRAANPYPSPVQPQASSDTRKLKSKLLR